MRTITKNKNLPYLYLITVFCLTYLGIIYWPGVGFSARYLGWGFGLLLPVLITPSFFNQRFFLLLIVYTIVVFMNYMAGDLYFSNMKKVVEGLVTLYIPLGMTYYAMKFRNTDWIRAVFYVAMFTIVWITIATAIIDAQIPGAVRWIHTALQNGDEKLSDFKHYYAFGMSNYLLPHALPAIIPVFAISLRQKEVPFKRKIVPIFLLLCVMMLIYFSGATGPMLVSVGVLAISLWIKPRNLRGAIISMIFFSIVTLPFLFNDDIMLILLQWIDDLLGNEGYFHGKIISFQEAILMGESTGSVETRQNLFLEDIEAFSDNIIIGTHATGGHSVILGRLGSLGLIGFIPYMMVLYEQAKMSVKIIPSNYRIYYYLGTFAAFLMIFTKGIASWEVYFCWFTLLPIGVVFFADRNQKLIKKRIK